MHQPSNAIFWWLDFAAPRGTTLSRGKYRSAERFPFQLPERPGLSVSGEGRGCNELTGEFTVYAIEIAPDDSVNRFEASFEQHCEQSPLALRGRVAVLSNPWRSDRSSPSRP